MTRLLAWTCVRYITTKRARNISYSVDSHPNYSVNQHCYHYNYRLHYKPNGTHYSSVYDRKYIDQTQRGESVLYGMYTDTDRFVGYAHSLEPALHSSVSIRFFKRSFCISNIKLAIPVQAPMVPGGWDSQISRQSSHEDGKVVSPTHRPPLHTRKYSWYSFLLEAESTPGP